MTPTHAYTHKTWAPLLHGPIKIALVGCGGSGSQLLTGLARIHAGLRALGHPGGLHVTAYDPDRVSAANVGRQLFAQSDIGRHKAILLTHRLNCYYGLDWDALPMRYQSYHSADGGTGYADIVISCVDSAKSRREIHAQLIGRNSHTPRYWLDLGNEQHTGQIILGEPDAYSDKDREIAVQSNRVDSEHLRKMHRPRLPTVTDIYPELLQETFAEDTRPSCSLAESLNSQDLFINQAMATMSLQLLWRLLRVGEIAHHGYYINLESGKINPIPVPTPTHPEKRADE